MTKTKSIRMAYYILVWKKLKHPYNDIKAIEYFDFQKAKERAEALLADTKVDNRSIKIHQIMRTWHFITEPQLVLIKK